MPNARAIPLALAAALSSGALASAWAFQLVGGYLPCQLCLLQRNPYYVGIPLLLAALALATLGREAAARAFAALGAVAFIVGAAIGVYHAGAEWHLWQGPSSCGATASVDLSAADLLTQLQATKVASCTEAAFRFLGLSFAGWNVVASAAVAALAARAALPAHRAPGSA